MKLDKTLNFKKVRCVKGYDDCLEIGKEYEVIDISVEIKVKDDEGKFLYWESDHFEPVLDSAENPLQGVELTPEFEAVAPKFKVGDKVYRLLLEPKIFTILGVDSDNTAHFGESGKFGYEWWSFKNLCHATQENYERLQATFPDIEFEQPPKPLTGNDLCRAIKAKGKKFIICAVSDISEEDAINNYLNGDKEMDVIFEIDDELDHPFVAVWGNLYKFAVPLNEETGEPLTESILND